MTATHPMDVQEKEDFAAAMAELSKKLGIPIPESEALWQFGIKVWEYGFDYAYAVAYANASRCCREEAT